MANYRGPLVVKEQEKTESNADRRCNIVSNEAREDDVEGSAPHTNGQEEQVAKKMEIDMSMPT